jgi:hypothetical protein
VVLLVDLILELLCLGDINRPSILALADILIEHGQCV